LTEAIDTTTPTGGTMMQMVEAFAEFERHASRAHEGGIGCCPRGRANRGDAGQNSRLNSTPRSEVWFPRATKRPLMLQDLLDAAHQLCPYSNATRATSRSRSTWSKPGCNGSGLPVFIVTTLCNLIRHTDGVSKQRWAPVDDERVRQFGREAIAFAGRTIVLDWHELR
jgi:hypothetical protein